MDSTTALHSLCISETAVHEQKGTEQSVLLSHAHRQSFLRTKEQTVTHGGHSVKHSLQTNDSEQRRTWQHKSDIRNKQNYADLHEALYKHHGD